MNENFAELFKSSLLSNNLSVGSTIKAVVIDITDNHVILNASLKSEAHISISQFKDVEGTIEVSIGDTVDVFLDSYEDGYGETKLSREKAKRLESWRQLQDAHDNNKIVKGLIVSRVRGGFTVDINFVKAFLPGSLVDVKPIRDPAFLEGQTCEFKVIKIDEKRNNIVVSRKAVIEQESSVEREFLIKTLTEGAIVKGKIKNLTDYGAFIDLGGIDGLLHITDISWKRIRHPSEVLQEGADVEVVVLNYDKEKNRVSLGMKQLDEDPWKDIERRFPVGARIFGTVSNIADYGVFIEIDNGIEGLVHVSEVDWTNKNVSPSKVFHLGDEAEVMVLEIDESRRRISLGIKQCQTNPWEDFKASYQVGNKVTGEVRSITDFGLFIGLGGNIDGLVHLSDLSWNGTGEDQIRSYSKGDEITAVILSIDVERERISLGVKQVEDDPIKQFTSLYPKNTSVEVVVKEVLEDGAVVSFNGTEIDGFIKSSEISNTEKVFDARNHLTAGSSVQCLVGLIDKKSNRINLSMRDLVAKEEKDAVKEYGSKTRNKDVTGTTLGDLLDSRNDQE
jgi:small subunit ribosomal protein S1